MHFIKRAAARALAAPASTLLRAAPRTSTPLSIRQSASVMSAFKRYNSSTSASDEPISTDASEQSSVSSAVAAAAETGALGFGMDNLDGTRPNSRPPMDLQPTNSVYVGNLLFEVTPQDLEREFAPYGEIVTSRIAQDPRGLSKGFGYIEFRDIESARNAIEQRNQTIFEGRRLIVNYMAKTRSNAKSKNPPSKTLFIGNLAFEMTDADLNKLFRDIVNVIDVRVAIDRRTGQPRGFAHADFTDVESAVKAAEILEGKEVYNRSLRLDYSLTATRQNVGFGRGDRAPRGDRGNSF
ncbi:hypothetical protein VC83_04296 [Pseudogymnoascus destructans]|uniref:RRM domain-containing protein n=2 Tax=Pseudogymnoascus destructans TaxID=655981 RepID=L8FRS9_PSED2|nr:uncharacterized protein VC83_04296 [Pseudogymnoascus destructans]ELR02421.1 hypothetical protein GMDG_05479 [Pseudogymnoascus destructans 20631-21]OAF59056.2 hypothetical protein VC83_04296 [Pseudogymnoascus destructans]